MWFVAVAAPVGTKTRKKKREGAEANTGAPHAHARKRGQRSVAGAAHARAVVRATGGATGQGVTAGAARAATAQSGASPRAPRLATAPASDALHRRAVERAKAVRSASGSHLPRWKVKLHKKSGKNALPVKNSSLDDQKDCAKFLLRALKKTIDIEAYIGDEWPKNFITYLGQQLTHAKIDAFMEANQDKIETDDAAWTHGMSKPNRVQAIFDALLQE